MSAYLKDCGHDGHMEYATCVVCAWHLGRAEAQPASEVDWEKMVAERDARIVDLEAQCNEMHNHMPYGGW